MPPKARIPAPIDRPLSRAYLRMFTGWSTAYPPGVSEPTSLAKMDNLMINREGSVRIRPGLRYLSYDTLPDEELGTLGTSTYPSTYVVGTHESFFLNNGERALLYAVREIDTTIGFRVLTKTPLGAVEQSLEEAGFDIPQGYTGIAFSAATTYVKYLQIDNKIFALSNAGETMRLFYVGAAKSVKRLDSITRPSWTVEDKLTVVHPDASWINSGIPTSVRYNRVRNPSLETTLTGWQDLNTDSRVERTNAFARTGAYSMKVSSRETRRNLCRYVLDTAITTVGWGHSPSSSNIIILDTAVGGLRAFMDAGFVGMEGKFYSHLIKVTPGQRYKFAYDLIATAGLTRLLTYVQYYNAAGALLSSDFILVNDNVTTTLGRKYSNAIVPPTGAASVRVFVAGHRATANGTATWNIGKVMFYKESESGTFFSGATGANYFWTGAANASESVYHTPKDATAYARIPVPAGGNWTLSFYARAGSTQRLTTAIMRYMNVADQFISSSSSTPVNDGNGTWDRISISGVAPAGTTSIDLWLKFAGVPFNEVHYIDDVLLEAVATLEPYFDGSMATTAALHRTWTGAIGNSVSAETAYSVGSTNPPAETPTGTGTLISSVAADNDYSFGFFYTFSNEIGESAVSQATVVRAQRSWAAWLWKIPNAAGEPTGALTNNPAECADQLAAYMPQAVFDAAISMGATSWSLYMFTWSDVEPIPVTAVKVGTKQLDSTSAYGTASWLRATPSQAEATAETAAVPALRTRFNSSEPSRGGQGLVAADRMILVNDPTAPGVIKWTSNQQGSYSDFSPSKGGGFKTLTSGNLFIPSVVKLWQNPQSADTLTILCEGVDGYSTGYYMAPAQIASQSETTNVMGFEETSSSPGTVSPYGCETLNNSLYRPLDESIMKSSASNYNINHMSITDKIEDMWRQLSTKRRIVSSQLDNRIYYLVNNPKGAPLESACWGNEVWVFDAQQKAGTWSRWTVQGQSLRKIEQGGQIVMALTHPTGIFYFDESAGTDHYVDENGVVRERNISWSMEMNTQGANRAHDAWCNLQQVSLTLGYFQGKLEWGVRGLDTNGMWVNESKITRDNNPPGETAFDIEDHLQVRRNLKEWIFYAHSVPGEPSYGQISAVQYRYTPISVNVGYEFGSVETFEYGQSDSATRTSDNGVPMPYIDTRRT